MAIESVVKCDLPGCGALRRTVNHWYVVVEDDRAIHIYRWDKCPPSLLTIGKHLCGITHAIAVVSSLLTPQILDANRESTLNLKPPLDKRWNRTGSNRGEISNAD